MSRRTSPPARLSERSAGTIPTPASTSSPFHWSAIKAARSPSAATSWWTTKPSYYETTPSYPVTIRATDVYGKFLDQNFAIAVDNVSFEIINGTPGNDRLVGGTDRDFITGFRGKDRMTGHGAADRFVFKAMVDSRPGPQHDVITDFDRGSGQYVHAEGDRIDLTRLEAAYHAHFGFVAQAITHAGPRNHVGFDSAHGLLQLDLNGDGKVDFEVALNLYHFVRGDLLL